MATIADRLDYPGAFVPDLQRLGDETLSLLDSDPDGAKTTAVAQLDLIRAAEAAIAHPLHKGQPLFNFSTMLPGLDEIPGIVTRALTDHRRLPAIVAAWLTERVPRTPSPRPGAFDPSLITASGVGYARDRTPPIPDLQYRGRPFWSRRLGAAGRSATRRSRSSSTSAPRNSWRNGWRAASRGPRRS